MRQPKCEPWRFWVVVVLILLAGGGSVGVAAWLTVTPQEGEMVQVETSPQTYGINDQLFYPWNCFDGEDMAQLVPWDQGPDQSWYENYLHTLPEYLGFTGMEASVTKGRTGEGAGFWTDCPAAAANGQPALLDVAYAQQEGQFGMGWVARSTGEVPTQAQRDAAVAQVQWDVCAWLGSLESTVLEDNVMYLQEYLHYGSLNFPPTHREETAFNALSPILEPLSHIRAFTTNWENGVDRTNWSEICQAAADCGLQLQLATTQRQVVLVLSPIPQAVGAPSLLAVYYDMVLEQYSGLVVNGPLT